MWYLASMCSFTTASIWIVHPQIVSESLKPVLGTCFESCRGPPLPTGVSVAGAGSLRRAGVCFRNRRCRIGRCGDLLADVSAGDFATAVAGGAALRSGLGMAELPRERTADTVYAAPRSSARTAHVPETCVPSGRTPHQAGLFEKQRRGELINTSSVKPPETAENPAAAGVGMRRPARNRRASAIFQRASTVRIRGNPVPHLMSIRLLSEFAAQDLSGSDQGQLIDDGDGARVLAEGELVLHTGRTSSDAERNWGLL